MRLNVRQKTICYCYNLSYFWVFWLPFHYLFKYLTKHNLLSGEKLTKNNSLMGLFGPEHFVNSGILKSTPFDLNCLKHKSILCTDELLAAEVSAAKVTSFNVNCFKVNFSAGAHVFKKLKTWFTSHVTKYLGSGGHIEYTPFMNLDIKGCLPMTIPSMGWWKFEIADLYTPIVRYLYPLWSSSARNSRITFKDVEKGSTCLWSHQLLHAFQALSYWQVVFCLYEACNIFDTSSENPFWYFFPERGHATKQKFFWLHRGCTLSVPGNCSSLLSLGNSRRLSARRDRITGYHGLLFQTGVIKMHSAWSSWIFFHAAMNQAKRWKKVTFHETPVQIESIACHRTWLWSPADKSCQLVIYSGGKQIYF